MKRYLALSILFLSASLAAQQPAPSKAPAAPGAVPRAPVAPTAPPDTRVFNPEAGGQPLNIRLDVSITDQIDGAAGQPKTVMVLLVDRAGGQARAAFEDRQLSVDALPMIMGGRIRVRLAVASEYPPSSRGKTEDTVNWRHAFSLLLDNGKPTVALETFDAATKRKLSIEAKATIQK